MRAASAIPSRHPALPLERVVRHRGPALPGAWAPTLQRLAEAAGGAGEVAGTRLHAYLPDTAADREFAQAAGAAFGDALLLEPPRVREGEVAAVQPVMSYRCEVPLRLAGRLRGELHVAGIAPDAFDITLHAARARGRAPLAALLRVDAWLAAAGEPAASLAMRLAAWEPLDPGPRAA